MSLPWRDQVRIVLGPDRLAAVRLGGLRRRVLAADTVACGEPGPDWQPALAALADFVKHPSWQNADATVILSGWFVSYQLLPASDTRLDDDERLALARHVMGQAQGAAAGELELRVSGGAPGAAAVVSGVHRALLAGVRDTLAASTLRLQSVQPGLMSSFNAWRREWRAAEAQWFTLAEPGTLCAALLHGGELKALRVKRSGGDWARELQLLLKRECLADPVAQSAFTVSVCVAVDEPAQAAIDWPADAPGSLKRLQLPRLRGWSTQGGGAYTLALAGA